MAKSAVERIRAAVRAGSYDVTAHAVDEAAEDDLDIIDVETAVLTGSLAKVEKDDPRGTRYTIRGHAADGSTPVGVLGRFTRSGRYLMVTVYKVTE